MSKYNLNCVCYTIGARESKVRRIRLRFAVNKNPGRTLQEHFFLFLSKHLLQYFKVTFQSCIQSVSRGGSVLIALWLNS